MHSPVLQYRQNEQAYNYIQERLDRTRETFLQAHRSTQKGLLFQSITFALVSVQTPLEPHEDAFVGLLQADSRDEFRDALAEVNYNRNKLDYIQHNMTAIEEADDVIDYLQVGDVDTAHELIDEQFKGVSVTKAGFALALLGFTGKMCIDTNVKDALDLDYDRHRYNRKAGVDIYNRDCRRARAQYPELARAVTPFLFQWVVFDWHRDVGVTTHDPWFLAVEQLTA